MNGFINIEAKHTKIELNKKYKVSTGHRGRQLKPPLKMPDKDKTTRLANSTQTTKQSNLMSEK